jgi:hypothetical protein
MDTNNTDNINSNNNNNVAITYNINRNTRSQPTNNPQRRPTNNQLQQQQQIFYQVLFNQLELPFEINIFEYSFVNHVQLDIRIWNLEIRMCRISRLIRI